MRHPDVRGVVRCLLPETMMILDVLAATFGRIRSALKVLAYEGFGRDRWQRPAEIVQRLAIRPGETIADLGAGGGYFTFRLAAATGPSGRVHAVDTDPDMLAHLRARVTREGVANVDVVEGSETRSGLPPASVDVAFSCDAYHHLADRRAYFARLRTVLRPGGRLAVIDHDGSAGIMSRWFGHATPPTVMAEELDAAGYRVIASFDDFPGQSFLLLSPT
jgi:ubiquinone/menaquinone biosynthesis C-methylase UbiE